MSQKTNPTSLRLQKNHKHFESCWYSDYFYSEINSHDSQIRSYIESVLNQVTYSRALLCAQNYYKRFVIYLFIQDTRGIRSEREQFLRSLPTGGIKMYTQLPVRTTTMAQAKLGYILFFWRVQTFGVSLGTSTQSIVFFGNSVFERNSNLSPFPIFKESKILLSKGPKKMVPRITTESGFSNLKESSKSTRFFKPRIEFEKPSTASPKRSFGEASLREFVWNKLGFIETLYRLTYKKFTQKNKFTNGPWDMTPNHRGWWLGSWPHHSSAAFKHQSEVQAPQDYSSYSQLIEMALMPNIYQANVAHWYPFRKTQETSFCVPSFTSIYPIRIIQDSQNAHFLINEVVNLLQKRVGFKQIKDQLLREILNTTGITNQFRRSKEVKIRQLYSHHIIKGFRLSCSGRFGGRSKKAQKTKTQSIRWGETSLHVFDSKLSFASKSANTSFGKIGIKVWICFF